MPLKILSVDDSKTVRLIVARALRPYDCVLCEAGNGEEGLAVAAKELPHLVILDVTMPVMDGVTMLEQMKQNEQLKTIPVLMLTAEAAKDNRAYIASLGAQEYIVKPFREPQLIEKIQGLVPLQAKPAAPAAAAAPAPSPTA